MAASHAQEKAPQSKQDEASQSGQDKALSDGHLLRLVQDALSENRRLRTFMREFGDEEREPTIVEALQKNIGSSSQPLELHARADELDEPTFEALLHQQCDKLRPFFAERLLRVDQRAEVEPHFKAFRRRLCSHFAREYCELFAKISRRKKNKTLRVFVHVRCEDVVNGALAFQAEVAGEAVFSRRFLKPSDLALEATVTIVSDEANVMGVVDALEQSFRQQEQ